MTPVLGIVGAIGAGKSTVALALAQFGGAVIDADRIGHEVLELPPVRSKLIARWGLRILRTDHTIDRRAIGRIVFDSQSERTALESLVYPFIEARCRSEIAMAQRNPANRFVVLDAAVMLEAGWTGVCDRLIYVDAPEKLRQQRVAARSQWSAADLSAREAAQMLPEKKRQQADAVIINDGSPEHLHAALRELLLNWKLHPAD